MTEEPSAEPERLALREARDLTKCFGRHRFQTLDYALHYCLQCRKLKSCVRSSWGMDRQRPWRKDDWWPDDTAAAASQTQPRTNRKPVNIS